MAEGFLTTLANGRFEAVSTGLEQNIGVNPLTFEVMNEVGIDISLHAEFGALELSRPVSCSRFERICEASVPSRAGRDWQQSSAVPGRNERKRTKRKGGTGRLSRIVTRRLLGRNRKPSVE
jgi:hypothetical protein